MFTHNSRALETDGQTDENATSIAERLLHRLLGLTLAKSDEYLALFHGHTCVIDPRVYATVTY